VLDVPIPSLASLAHASVTGAAAPPAEGGLLEAWARVLSFQGGYNTNVVLFGTILLGISAGAVGSFAMLKGRALVADAISHASLVGVALAFLLHSALGQQERSMPLLMLGAAVSGACAVVAIEWISKHTRLSPETAVATVSSSSFGAGIVALSATRRVEGADRAGLDELIFGSTASMTRADALLMAVLAAAALGATLALYRVLTAVAFNERFARSKGLPVRLLDAVLAALVGAVAMAGLQAVGMLLVAALLVAPAATARLWTTRVAPMVLVAAAAGAGAAWVGASFSAVTPGAPAGPLIILSAASTFMLSLLIAPERGLLSGWLRHRRIAAAARRVAATEGQPRPGGEAS
jgi:manganese/zinc/iron transport system permease protein